MEIFGNARRDEPAKPWIAAFSNPGDRSYQGTTSSGVFPRADSTRASPHGGYSLAGGIAGILVPVTFRRETTQPSKHRLRFCLRGRHAVNLP
jgi:hypothetical protein